MAIQKTFEFKGVQIIDAYHKVAWVKIYKNISGVFVCWVSTEHKVSRTSEVIWQQESEFEFDISGGNPIAQSYVYLKSLPEFTDAIDC